MSKKPSVIDSETWTLEDLRLLASVRGSALHKPLSLALTQMRDDSKAPLLNPATDFPATQFHRGRLAALNDLVLLLEHEAPRRYDEARKQASDRPPET